jgi:alpha-beta hydrolase superfamily lysophospholipase
LAPPLDAANTRKRGEQAMANTITTKDGTQIYYKDGYRCIAHDRRGHGRSPTGLCTTLKDHVNADLLAFIKAGE